MSKKKNSKTHNWVKLIISMSIDDVKVSFTFHFWENDDMMFILNVPPCFV
jgi:hypothetical protein